MRCIHGYLDKTQCGISCSECPDRWEICEDCTYRSEHKLIDGMVTHVCTQSGTPEPTTVYSSCTYYRQAEQ